MRMIICPARLNGYVLNATYPVVDSLSDAFNTQILNVVRGRFSARGLDTGLPDRSLLFDH
jgi:hypothetical protein